MGMLFLGLLVIASSSQVIGSKCPDYDCWGEAIGFVNKVNITENEAAPQTHAVTFEECCVPTCTVYTCLDGHVEIESNEFSTVLSEENCCQPTCEVYTCKEGRRNKHHRFSTTFTEEHCCHTDAKTCADFPCSEGYKNNTFRSAFDVASPETCCLPEITSHVTDLWAGQHALKYVVPPTLLGLALWTFWSLTSEDSTDVYK
jgi:hypothetical protein